MSKHPPKKPTQGKGEPQQARILGRLKEVVEEAQKDESAEVLVTHAETLSAMKIVVLLASQAAKFEFSSPRSRRNCQRASADISEAQGIIVPALMECMGPAAAAIFLTKLLGAICRGNSLPRDKLLRLCRHFLADAGEEGHLPLDQVLEIGAQFAAPTDDEG